MRDLCGRPLIQHWQGVDDLHGLDADADDALEEVEDVAGGVVFAAPVVGVVSDAAVLVHRDLVALQDPIEGRLAVHKLVLAGVEPRR